MPTRRRLRRSRPSWRSSITSSSPAQYWDKARNFSEARQLLPSDVFQATTESEMPTSFWCAPVVLQDASQVVRTFSGTAGVAQVTEPQQTIHNEETVINVSKWVCLAIAIVLIVSAAVLILNTIRMAIFARRREVSVMKLVGATNWFIRIPFMSEGLLQGLLGSCLAAGVVYLMYLFIEHAGGGKTSSNIFTAMQMTGTEVLLTNIVVVVVGMAIGSIGSLIAIRRFWTSDRLSGAGVRREADDAAVGRPILVHQAARLTMCAGPLHGGVAGPGRYRDEHVLDRPGADVCFELAH